MVPIARGGKWCGKRVPPHWPECVKRILALPQRRTAENYCARPKLTQWRGENLFWRLILWPRPRLKKGKTYFWERPSPPKARQTRELLNFVPPLHQPPQ